VAETGTKSTRRSFFLQGGAVLGAGVAATAAASTEDARLRELQDREAIRGLQLAFASLIENGTHDAAAELFEERAHLNLSGVSATGRPAILKLFADQYREQKAAVLHSAYRQNTSQQSDVLTFNNDGLQAAATFNVEVELCTPLQDDCTVAQMARLQGNMADRRWESGRLEAQYVKRRGQWKISSLTYTAI
jgi:hypothetical protein